jgi:hypothetical protein
MSVGQTEGIAAAQQQQQQQQQPSSPGASGGRAGTPEVMLYDKYLSK